MPGSRKLINFLKLFIFIIGLLIISANFSFAQTPPEDQCKDINIEQLRSKDACSIYNDTNKFPNPEFSCNNNICGVTSICGWNEKEQKCKTLANFKPLEVSYPNVPGYGTINQYTSPAEYIRYVFVFGLWILGIVSLSMLIYAGILWFFSGADSGAKAKAIEMLRNITMGVFLFLATYLIFNTLNPDLLTLKKEFAQYVSKIELPRPAWCDQTFIGPNHVAYGIKLCGDYNALKNIDVTKFPSIFGEDKARSSCILNICKVPEKCWWGRKALSGDPLDWIFQRCHSE